ncbi:hypothetical protein FUT87_07450 [Mitsuaria sp. TWR114]|uniref:hypothetical protein n=1 Tax=Mitsuaria sp. TWR114 TaxID=2601731 RepID=UPI0011BFBE77|nr:hypothetical protein [Mitsuaria sp. TWR114]TXD94237.1 hypothetical protein FUT87_07450 [Mitsuaria sp. TWR114]
MNPELPKDLGRRLGDLSDLPEALLKQINAVKLDDLEEQIVTLLREKFGGVANVDELIVGLYRDYNYITEDRRKLGSKLYRMQQSDLIESVPKRKGVYRLKERDA